MIRWRDHPEMVEFMINFIPGHHEWEIADAFREKFGISMSRSQIKNFKMSYHVRSGTKGGLFVKGQTPHNKGMKMSAEMYELAKPTMFKKGHVPHNHKPVGSERMNADGYVMVKVAEPNKWRLKQRLIWEEQTGEKLTSNETIVFLDGDKTNFSEDNLYKLTRAELVRYNQDGLHCQDRDISLTAVAIAKIKARRKGVNRNGKGNEKE